MAAGYFGQRGTSWTRAVREYIKYTIWYIIYKQCTWRNPESSRNKCFTVLQMMIAPNHNYLSMLSKRL